MLEAKVWTALYGLLPFIATGVLFLAITRFDWLPLLRVPVHERLFGKNKTWRGILIAPLIAGVAAYGTGFLEPLFPALLFRYSEHNAFLLGFTLELVYMLSELPNSYVKRRRGIPPGKRPERSAWLFAIIDLLDSAPSVIVVLVLWTPLSVTYLLQIVLAGAVLKLLLNYALYVLGIRKEPI